MSYLNRDNTATTSLTPFDYKFVRRSQNFVFSLFGKAVLGTTITIMIGKEKATVDSYSKTKSSDDFGTFTRWTLDCRSTIKRKLKFTCIMTVYSHFVIFETVNHFEIKGKKNKSAYGNPYISFPVFEGDTFDNDCSCITFKRQAPFNYPEIYTGRVLDSLREGRNSPLFVTNHAFETVVISPLDHLLFGTVSINRDSKCIRCGIPRSLSVIPKGTSCKTVLIFGQGVHATIEFWGKLLRSYHQTQDISPQGDRLLKYISYWTNAGSAYWYRSYKRSSYESTLKTLVDHHRKIGLNFGSYQLDSWWYIKEGDQYFSGITEWEPKSETLGRNFNSALPFFAKERKIRLFEENRLSYVSSKVLGTTIGCHFKQLSNDSVYVARRPKDFLIDKYALPKNRESGLKLFKTIFDHPKWHLSYIIHDWLSYMNDHHFGFQDMQVAEDYFYSVDKACMETTAPNDSGHLSLQLCMTQPHMTLNSVTMPSVTTIRSTSDSNSFFVEGTKRWWWHTFSSVFITSLGKYPFYDNRYTNKSYLFPLSAYSKFEMILLGLSCGPIGIGDKVGKENVRLILRCIKENGEIIKPDVPSILLDRCFLSNPNSLKSKSGITVYSYSKIVFNNELDYQATYLLNFNVHPYARAVSVSYRLEEAGIHVAEDTEQKVYALYDYFSKTIELVSAQQTLTFHLKRRKFYYQIAVPVSDGFALIGDVSKHVSASGQLIESLNIKEKHVDFVMKYLGDRFPSQLVCYSETRPEKVLLQGDEQKFSYDNMLLSVTPDIDILRKHPSERYQITIVYR